MVEHYKYEKLGPQEIRILQISRDPISDKVKYTLRHVPFEDGVTYTALSYTWGNQHGTPIMLDGCQFPIGKNLSKVLHRLYKETEDGEDILVWIDAICINQQDEVEKSTQVRRMKEIYEQSKQVIVWLGEEAEDSGYAMGAIGQVDRRWATRTSLSAADRQLLAPNLDHRSTKAIHDLFRRPWWNRVWIIQEATCANNTYVWCGKDKADFLGLVAVAKFLAQRIIRQATQQNFSTPDIRHLQRAIDLYELKTRRSCLAHGSNLLELLENSRGCEASDSRDKIFALAGLAIRTHREAMHPDYSIPPHEVYAKFTKNFIEADGTLNILGHCQEALPDSRFWSSFKTPTPTYESKRITPSWAPNWSIMLEATPLIKYELPNHVRSKKMYHASGNFLPSVQPANDLEVLVLRGSVFDTVSKLGENFADPLSASKIQAWYSWVGEQLGSTYPTGESTEEAFLHTLVADIQIREGRSARGFAASWPIRHDLGNADESAIPGVFISMALHNRGMFLSSEGYMGLARFDVIEGDKICILHGGHVPFILREESHYYLFKGECYVHGLMDGEGMRYPKVWQQFSLH